MTEDPTELARQLSDALRRSVQSMRLLDGEGELSTSQAAALARVYHGPLTVSRYARISGVTLASASQQINRLEAAGWITRVSDDGDGRRVLVEITKEGRSALRRSEAVRNRRIAGLLEEFSEDDRRALARALPVFEQLFTHIATEEEKQ